MPFWLILALGAGLVYLIKQGQQSPTSSGVLPATIPSTSSTGGDDFGPPQVSTLQVGQQFQLPQGTQLYTDSKLQATSGSDGGVNVAITGTGVATDGRVSASYVNTSGKTVWFAQPGT